MSSTELVSFAWPCGVNTDDEKKNHTVEKVLQVGYKIGDRIIRPAKVTIYEYKK